MCVWWAEGGGVIWCFCRCMAVNVFCWNIYLFLNWLIFIFVILHRSKFTEVTEGWPVLPLHSVPWCACVCILSRASKTQPWHAVSSSCIWLARSLRLSSTHAWQGGNSLMPLWHTLLSMISSSLAWPMSAVRIVEAAVETAASNSALELILFHELGSFDWAKSVCYSVVNPHRTAPYLG